MKTREPSQEGESTNQLRDGPDPSLLDENVAEAVGSIWQARDRLAAQARGSKRYRSYWAWSAAILGPIAVLSLALRTTGVVGGSPARVCASIELGLLVVLLSLGLSGPVSRTIRFRHRAGANERLPLLWPVWMLIPSALAAVLALALHLTTLCVVVAVLGLFVAVPGVTFAFHALGLEAAHCRWISARGQAEELKRDAWLVASGLLQNGAQRARAEAGPHAPADRKRDGEAVWPPAPFFGTSQLPFILTLSMREAAAASRAPRDPVTFWRDYRAKRIDKQVRWFEGKAREHHTRDTWYETTALLALSVACALSAVGLCDVLGGHAAGPVPLLTAIHIVLPLIGASALLLRSLDSGHHLAASYAIHSEILRAVSRQLADGDATQALSLPELHSRIAAAEAVLMEELICWWLAVRCEEVRAV